MEFFLANIYHKGFEDGVKASDNADFKIKLVQVLENTKGIGPKITNRILETVKGMELNENV